MPRQPILSVLGHVDSGKTTLLDNIRESRVTEGEAGGITQMIGATEVPLDTLKGICGGLLESLETDLTIPGILFIDTPGHAAFSSLRKRGGSISDIAILVVDVTDGIQPQTEEAIKILKDSNTPFVVALNKVDTIHGWQEGNDLISRSFKDQPDHVMEELDTEIYELMGELSERDIISDRFDRVDNFQEKVAIVPISAMTGEGLPELLMVLTGLSQNYLGEKLEIHEGVGKGTVLEVTQVQGLGTTLDVILYDGIINKEDKLVFGTSEGVKVTDLRALLEPRPLKEIRLDRQYQEVDRVEPAAGVKLVGKDVEGVISGAPIRTANEENLEKAKKEVEEELQSVEFETQGHGVVVKADSLGSLEALMREIEDIPVQKAEVGAVTKSDVIEVQNEEPGERAIFAFNVSTTENGEEAIRDKDVELFQSKVIYEIVKDYTEWRDELKKKQRRNALNAISRPAKFQLMPDHIFRKSDPAVAGVKVLDGVLTPGGSVMNTEGDSLGTLKSIQEQNDTIEKADKGSEVAASITSITIGRDVEEGEVLYTDITGREYRQLQELEDLLTEGEKAVLEEIVEIKDSKNPHWKLG